MAMVTVMLGGVSVTVKTCAPMTLPEHAYFVQGQCSHEINAACGIRCQTGYQLHGSSLRLCNEDGLWTGTDVTCHGQFQFQLPLSFLLFVGRFGFGFVFKG